jgi:hypothetical protein
MAMPQLVRRCTVADLDDFQTTGIATSSSEAHSK